MSMIEKMRVMLGSFSDSNIRGLLHEEPARGGAARKHKTAREARALRAV